MANSKKAIDKNYLLTQFKNFDSELLSKKYSSKEDVTEIEKAVFVDTNIFETESTNDFSIFNYAYSFYWKYNNTSIKVGDILVIKKDLTLSGTYTLNNTTYNTTVTLPKGNYRYLSEFVEAGGAIRGIFVADMELSFFDPSSSNYGKYWQTFESKNISKLDEFEAEVDKEFNLIVSDIAEWFPSEFIYIYLAQYFYLQKISLYVNINIAKENSLLLLSNGFSFVKDYQPSCVWCDSLSNTKEYIDDKSIIEENKNKKYWRIYDCGRRLLRYENNTEKGGSE